MDALHKKPIVGGLAAICLSACFYFFAMPGGGIPHFAWVAQVPLFLTLRFGPIRAFWSWLLGITLAAFSITYWLYYYLFYILEISALYSFLLILCLSLIISLPYAISAYWAAKWKLLKTTFGGVKIALLMASLVALFPTPFPVDLTYAFYRLPIFLQMAELGSTCLIHFMLIWINVLFASIFYRYFLSNKSAVQLKECLLLTLVFLVFITYGLGRIFYWESVSEGKPVCIGYVQPNILGKDLRPIFGSYYTKEEESNHFNSTLQLTKSLIQMQPNLDVIVWPEAPIDFPIKEVESVYSDFKKLMNVSRNKVPLFFVSTDPWMETSQKGYLEGKNTLFRINGNYAVSKPYQKANLIPFAEYLPGEAVFPILRKLFGRVGRLTRGKEFLPVKVAKDIYLLPLICYDGFFAEFARKFALKGGHLFVSMDNNINFGPTRASKIHLAALLLRSIENRLPLVRVNNSGPSLVIAPTGKIMPNSSTPSFKKSYKAKTFLVANRFHKTPYQTFGFTLPFLFLILFVLFMLNKKNYE